MLSPSLCAFSLFPLSLSLCSVPLSVLYLPLSILSPSLSPSLYALSLSLCSLSLSLCSHQLMITRSPSERFSPRGTPGCHGSPTCLRQTGKGPCSLDQVSHGGPSYRPTPHVKRSEFFQPGLGISSDEPHHLLLS